MFHPDDYPRASVSQLLTALERKEVTATQLTGWALERIARLDRRLHAISGLFADQALADARESDRRRAAGDPAGKLEGIPVLIKDNIAVRGWPLTAGSQALTGLTAHEDAPLVSRLRQEGAILLGKTAMHELAAGITGASSLTGYTENVFHTGYSPGGSSSGSAVAVAAGYTPFALGSDTAGSVRIPAAFAQIFGLRPTRGSIDMREIVPLSPSQDIAGPLVREAVDLRRVSEIMTGRSLPESGETLSVGVLSDIFSLSNESVVKQIRRSLQFPESVKIKEVSFPELSRMAENANIIAFEFAESLAQFLASHPGARYQSLKEILASGGYHPDLDTVFRLRADHPGTGSPDYQLIKQRQESLYTTLVSFFTKHQINLLAYPVIGQPPVRHGAVQNGSHALISATTGTPALSLPAGFDDQGMPVGLELLALRGREDLLLKAASLFPVSGRRFPD